MCLANKEELDGGHEPQCASLQAKSPICKTTDPEIVVNWSMTPYRLHSRSCAYGSSRPTSYCNMRCMLVANHHAKAPKPESHGAMPTVRQQRPALNNGDLGQYGDRCIQKAQRACLNTQGLQDQLSKSNMPGKDSSSSALSVPSTPVASPPYIC